MAFDHQKYNAIYVENHQAGNPPLNDAAGYGVKIEPADVAVGEAYWQVIGVHHLRPLENWSNHHVYLEILGQDGNRLRNPIGWVGWTWENRQQNEPARPVGVDKPDNEPGGNIAVGKNQLVSVWANGRTPGGSDKSDMVTGIRTTHPDEPLPDGSLYNTWGHHSFYVVFQEVVKEAAGNQADSVIFGKVIDGAGRTLRLSRQGTTAAEQPIADDDTFRFEGLPAGTYTLKVVGASVRRGGIKVDGANSREVTLSMPAPEESVIKGTVTNGLGHTIVLGKSGTMVARKTLPPTGRYKFENLPAGVYDLAVWDTTVKAANIALDGKNTRTVNLEVPEDDSGDDKQIDHYVLFGPPQSRGRRTNVFIAADFLLHFSLSAGFSLETAKLARRVTVIGPGHTRPELKKLRDGGAEVEHLGGDSYEIETILSQRIKDNQAFGS